MRLFPSLCRCCCCAVHIEISTKQKLTAEEIKLSQEEADFYHERLGVRMKNIYCNAGKSLKVLCCESVNFV